jgi:hypothetical protein
MRENPPGHAHADYSGRVRDLRHKNTSIITRPRTSGVRNQRQSQSWGAWARAAHRVRASRLAAGCESPLRINVKLEGPRRQPFRRRISTRVAPSDEYSRSLPPGH